MPAEAIGRARMKSTRAGSREEERRALELVLQAPSGEQPDPMGRWIATGALAE
jgi:hypothetical protein